MIVEIREEPADLRAKFLELTGYARGDILAWNFHTRRFMTKNGGQYELTEMGKVIHLSGPSPDPEDRL